MPHRLSRWALSALAVTMPFLLGGALVSSTAASAATTGTAISVVARPAPPPGRAAQMPGVIKWHLPLVLRDGRFRADDLGSINCTLNVQYPHPSSHVGGTVNDIATVSCNAPVAAFPPGP